MTAALAIAATSEILRFIIEDAVVRAAQALSFPSFGATLGPPPRPAPPPAAGGTVVEPTGVNLFLHHVTPNPAWRNACEPVRDSRGRRRNSNPLVLDLHYLLSAHGTDIDREFGLGVAMHALHQAAIVPRPLIRFALGKLASDANPKRKILAGEALADQVEQVTVTQQSLDIDAMTKIWTATQAPYRPSAGYLVTTVFLEDERASLEAPPVSDAGLSLVPLSRLSIERITAVANGRRVSIVPGASLLVEGVGLFGDGLAARLDGTPLTFDAAASRPGEPVLRLPDTTTTGPHLIEISRSASVNGRVIKIGASSVSVLVRPQASAPLVDVVPLPADPTRVSGTVGVTLSPAAERGQQVVLHLTHATSGDEITSLFVPPAAGAGVPDSFATPAFTVEQVPRGSYLLRVSIDGVISEPSPGAQGLQPQVVL
ncbi:DUF4255 domain-containing protein [Ancylobacter sp. 6x-1]|uniref:DUF4255 domain-containing protein n=1 Tax=Ancylobacter crimeensis TaxID=2579147 RepID=A0ABT0D5Y8_9HYPH|nr:DUF4255 domain-containing protein [Ancylobacter crimeensis]MCK0195360.1 DUF4255 domain-containing protein [Ancylobacter crimeensis]